MEGLNPEEPDRQKKREKKLDSKHTDDDYSEPQSDDKESENNTNEKDSEGEDAENNEEDKEISTAGVIFGEIWPDTLLMKSLKKLKDILSDTHKMIAKTTDDLNQIKRLRNIYEDIIDQKYNESTVLLYDVEGYIIEGIQLITDNGGDINAQDNDGNTALHYAV